MSARTTTAALTLLIGLVMMPFAINAATEQAATQTQVTGVEIPVRINETVEVPAPEDALNWSHTVTIEISGQPTIDGNDYEWHASNGTVFWHNTSQTRNADNATIDYSYGVLESGPTSAMASIFGFLANIWALLALVAAAGFTLLLLDRI